MSTTTDNSTRDAVLHELEWDPKVDASHIGVVANDGVIVLSGTASTFARRYASVRAAERVYGVRAVADEIEIKLERSHKRNDADIAASIFQQLKWHSAIPDSVTAEVLDGHVTLRGAVDWTYERDEAVRAVRHLTGVRNVIDQITLAPHAALVTDVQSRVENAIARVANLDARSIWITESGGRVQLHGHVHSFAEKRAAGRSASGAPGATAIDNDIRITL